MSGFAQIMNNMGFKVQSKLSKNKNTNGCQKNGIKTVLVIHLAILRMQQ